MKCKLATEQLYCSTSTAWDQEIRQLKIKNKIKQAKKCHNAKQFWYMQNCIGFEAV